jgi:UPF0271 protein
MRLDINADAGESFGRWELGHDAKLMDHVTSVNVAAGFHAGDPATMRVAARAAHAHGIQLGVHPGLPDLVGFGRRSMALTPEEAADLCIYQYGALSAIAAGEGARVEHVKPHGSLYGLIAKSAEHGVAVSRAIRTIDPDLILVLMDGAGADAAEASGARVIREAFVDLDYADDGSLIIERVKTRRDPDDVAERALRIANGTLRTLGGRELPTRARTICIHGDVDNAVEVARAVRARLAASGIEVSPMRELI